MSLVWANSPFSGTALLIELALADFANDEGRCWPSIASVAKKARCSETWVHKTIRRMQKMGRLKADIGGGRGKANVYWLSLFALENPVFNTGFNGTKSPERVHSVPEERVHSVTERVNRSAPDPSIDPSKEIHQVRPPQTPPLPSRVVAVAFEQSFGRLLSPTELELIKALEEEHPQERIEYALREAAALNKRSVRYVQRTCERIANDGGDLVANGNRPRKKSLRYET